MTTIYETTDRLIGEQLDALLWCGQPGRVRLGGQRTGG